jgi:hypothetical protein
VLDDQFEAIASESGQVFEDVDLSDDYYDYADVEGEVAIVEISTTVQVVAAAKGKGQRKSKKKR